MRVFAGTTAHPHYDAFRARVLHSSQHSLDLVCRYLRLPGFSATGEGILSSAQATLDHLRRVAGATAQIVPTSGHPVVYGEVRSPRPDAKTLIIYGLYDQTPLLSEEWAIDDPLAATVIEPRQAGLPAELGPVVCARAAHNHRGPVLSAILAVEAMCAAGLELPVNLIFVIEGEEEIGSPSLPAFVSAHRAELERADGAWLPCMYQSIDGDMLLYRGFKGAVFIELECRGGEWGGTRDASHLWAGHSPWIDAPMMRLIQAVGSLYDAEHRVTIDGLSPTPACDHADQQELAVLQHEIANNSAIEQTMRRILNVSRLRADKPLEELIARFLLDINLNVQGMTGGWSGPSFYTLLPGWARAKLDVRLPAGVTQADLTAALRAHLDRRGFEEIVFANLSGYEAARTAPDDPLLDAAVAAADAHGVTTTMWPTFNGSCPASLFQTLKTGIPFSFAGLGHGERPHAPNEYIKVDAVEKLMLYTATYLNEWARRP